MLVVFSAMTGCARTPVKKVVTVTGTATYQGQALTAGIVSFLAADGDRATATISPQGTFTMTDVVPGTHQVSYMAAPGGSGGPEAPKTKGPPKPPVVLPPKFADPKRSGVTVTVDDAGSPVVVEFK